MTFLNSAVSSQTQEFAANLASYERLREEVAKALEEARRGGGASSTARHRKRGKLTPRERISRLLDLTSAFIEVGALAGHSLYEDALPSAGLVTGIGLISNRPCMIIANDATVKGGTYYPITITKQIRAQDIARSLRLPCVYLVDSGGAYLPLQDEIFPGEHHFGRIFRNIAQMSSLGIAQIAAVMGSCTAGGAYVPALCDETVIVQGTGTIFLGGPQLVQAATGEIVDAETLGGAGLHTRRSAVADHLASDDAHALDIIRRILARAPGLAIASPPQADEEPLFPDKEIAGLIAANPRLPLPVRDILSRLLDGSRFEPYRELWGTTILCGTGHVGGYPVGVLVNDGVLFSESAQKAANFIEICCQRRIPLLFLHNISGFMVGEAYEAGGIARHGAKMVNAVACARVPKISLIIGGSYGAGNYAMCGRAFDPIFMAMWPNGRTAVMGGEQAATVLSLVRERQIVDAGGLWTDQEREAFSLPIRAKYHEASHPLYAASRMWVDAVIDPAETRGWLKLVLALCASAPVEKTDFGIFRM